MGGDPGVIDDRRIKQRGAVTGPTSPDWATGFVNEFGRAASNDHGGGFHFYGSDWDWPRSSS